MRHAAANLHFSHAFRPGPSHGTIEWEDMPSLAGALAERRKAAVGPGQRLPFAATNAWDETRPAELDPTFASQPFQEPLSGLAIREVCEPDVFRHFFGV